METEWETKKKCKNIMIMTIYEAGGRWDKQLFHEECNFSIGHSKLSQRDAPEDNDVKRGSSEQASDQNCKSMPQLGCRRKCLKRAPMACSHACQGEARPPTNQKKTLGDPKSLYVKSGRQNFLPPLSFR